MNPLFHQIEIIIMTKVFDIFFFFEDQSLCLPMNQKEVREIDYSNLDDISSSKLKCIAP